MLGFEGSNPARTGKVYVFGSFRLDESAEVLLHDADALPVGRRAVSLLRLLIEQPGTLISKQTLIHQAWSGQAVEDSNLTVQISALRRALGVATGGAKWIQTLAGRGYRYVGPPVAREGASVSTGAGASTAGIAAPLSIGERRQLTMLACELVSCSPADSVDLESLSAVIGDYQRHVDTICAEFGGSVLNCLGCTVLVCFGYPVAHENDPDRAIRAGLKLAGSVPYLKEVALAGRGQPRIAIVTSEAIVGGFGNLPAGLEHTVIGEIVGATMQLLARVSPGSVVVDGATKTHVGDLFKYSGFDNDPRRPEAWQMLATNAAKGRFDALRSKSLTPFVGREKELTILLERWRQAKAGRGQVVIVEGEPGIGKSRLLREFELSIRRDEFVRARCHCSPFHESTALFPFVGQLEQAAGIRDHEPPTICQQKLSRLISEVGGDDSESRDLTASLAPLFLDSDERIDVIDYQRKREKTLNALTRYFCLLASRQPLVATIEDAHWIDPTSMDLLAILAERISGLPALLLITCRSQVGLSWSTRREISTIPLDRLNHRDTLSIVRSVTGSGELTAEAVSRIAGRSDGVPFFAEEITKDFLRASRSRRQPPRLGEDRFLIALPSSLRGSLMARLDDMGSAKELAQTAAVLGREFSRRILEAVAGWPEPLFRDALDRLVDSDVFVEDEARASLRFRHALIQDAAYGSLLRPQLKKLHARTAQILDERFPETAARQPEILAHHCTEAGIVGRAIDLWQQSGMRSLRKSAATEAIRDLQRGIELIAKLRSDEARERREFLLFSALGQATWTVEGHGSRTEQLYGRAQDLLGANATAEEKMTVLVGLWRVKYHRGDLETALGLLRQCQALPFSRRQPEMPAHINRLLGMTLYSMGKFEQARAHLERAVDLYAEAKNDTSISAVSALTVFGADNAFSMLAHTLWVLGYSDRALDAAKRAEICAMEVGHTVTIGVAKVHSSSLKGELLDGLPLSETEQVVRYCTTGNVRMFLPEARFNHGLAISRNGDTGLGIEMMRAAMADAETIQTLIFVPAHLGHLAQAHSVRNELDLSMELLEQAVRQVESTGERMLEAELHRMKGEVLLKQNALPEAETAFEQAIGIARNQKALTFELRAATSLARYWGVSGRKAKGIDLLAETLARFSEGFGTKDLVSAKQALDDLRRCDGHV